jgi:hypothetical protein
MYAVNVKKNIGFVGWGILRDGIKQNESGYRNYSQSYRTNVTTA